MRFLLGVILFFCSFTVLAQSQSREDLEKRRIEIQKEIQQASVLLQEQANKKQSVLQESEDLANRIERQQELISVLRKEVSSLEKDIRNTSKKIQNQEKELQDLKDQYAALIYQAYKSKSNNTRLMFILSSDSFNQAYKRLQYMTQYTEFRQKQAAEIESITEQLETSKQVLELTKKEQENLLSQSRREVKVLEKDQEILAELSKEIAQKEAFYKAEIAAKQEEDAKIDSQIKELIRIAIAESKAREREKAKKAESFSGFALSPEAEKLQNNFVANKGKLPWPVDRGLITRKYGTQAHPTLKGIKIKSNGIRIETNKGSKAMAVFDGKVLAIQVQSNGTKNILVQHGNYITVYKNLFNLKVSKGETIQTGQTLGTIFTDQISGKTTLGFVLMKQVTPQNPQSWILSR